MDVLSALRSARLVPVVVLDDAADADALAGALVAGGLPIAEVTFRTAAAPDSIRAMAARGDILVGAGTVLKCIRSWAPRDASQALRRAADVITEAAVSSIPC